MKKICSISVLTLILYLSAINIIPVYAGELRGTDNQNYNLQTALLENEYENEATQEVFQHNNKQLYISSDDIELMAKLVSAESIGEPYEGKVAVASVVLHRTLDPSFPNTIRDVIFQKNAFSCVHNNTINAHPNKDCYNAVYDAIRGYDPSNEALFFYNPKTATCNWMKQTPKFNETTIGHHTFFKVKV